jgi:hypothetical protein
MKQVLGILYTLALVPGLLAADAIPVEVVETGAGYQLLRGGEPYKIRGAGLEYSDIGVFAGHGGNSIRTWRTGDEKFSGLKLLDDAHAHGVTVALCIEIGRERQGFDYNDEAAVAAQLEYARQEVLKYKDHPALLVWIIGNEPNLFYTNPRVFDAINDISEMIHEVDGQHPTTTALAGFNADLAEQITTRASDLDFVSIQMYGDVVNLPRYIDELGWTGPYMITEWGAIGHWEVRTTPWGAPVEQNSTDKANNYRKSHQIAIASNPQQVIGSYVFLWGQKQERTPTWYGMFLPDGSETEPVDVMHHIWKGEWPDNRAPRVLAMQLDQKTSADDIIVAAGSEVSASVEASDPDGDAVQYQWVLMQESQATQHGGDREEVPGELTGLISGGDTDQVTVTAPSQAGAYRLFVYTRDGRGKAGHANIPFQVE